MLPDRSKRYAGLDGEIPRLGLASNWQLFLMALLVGALLVMIFPRKALVEKLYAQETLDELTLSYIQNLYRASPDNADVAILLARTQQDHMDIASLESMLLALSTQGDTRQRTEARLILAKAYMRALEANPNTRTRELLTAHLAELMQAASQEPIPEHLARTFANLAFAWNMPALGTAFLDKIEVGRSPKALENLAKEALARGEYAVASQYYLMARDQTPELTDARRLYFAGINALMAASLFPLALQSANQHLGNLAHDPGTLRYLARTALSAGDPAQAALYARALVFEATGTAP